MASVELRPGDTLNIIWSSVQETPLGSTQVETMFAFSYDELLYKLKAKGKLGKSRRSGTVGARFSRFVALSINALKKGKWSTGASIDRGEVFDKLVKKLSELDPREYTNITQNAKTSLIDLYFNKTMLKQTQKNLLRKTLEGMGFSLEKKTS